MSFLWEKSTLFWIIPPKTSYNFTTNIATYTYFWANNYMPLFSWAQRPQASKQPTTLWKRAVTRHPADTRCWSLVVKCNFCLASFYIAVGDRICVHCRDRIKPKLVFIKYSTDCLVVSFYELTQYNRVNRRHKTT